MHEYFARRLIQFQVYYDRDPQISTCHISRSECRIHDELRSKLGHATSQKRAQKHSRFINGGSCSSSLEPANHLRSNHGTQKGDMMRKEAHAPSTFPLFCSLYIFTFLSFKGTPKFTETKARRRRYMDTVA